jgi:hypothetical protein
MMRREHGVTLLEVIAASVIGTLLAGGTMLAFVSAAKNTRTSVAQMDAVGLAQQTLERFRNRIACDGSWHNLADCTVNAAALPVSAVDPLPAGAPVNNFGGTRQYTVTPADCDGVGGPDDCLKVAVKVEWNPPP